MTKHNGVVGSNPKSTINMTVAPKPPTIPGNFIAMNERQLLKEGRLSSWIESMRASSPTHLRSTPSIVDELALLKQPSALDMFEQIIKASKGKQIVMFLDYDGTLSPIVEDPDRAFMSDAMRRTVRKLARCFPTAIVSGRCRDKVYNFVRLAELYYAGSHGMDIKGPAKGSKYLKGSQAVLFQPASEFLPMIDEVYKRLLEKTKSILGAKVEHNKFCLSVHFRCVDEKKWSELANEVKSVLREYSKLRLTQGRKVLEIRPTIEWDKGKALEFLLESLGELALTSTFKLHSFLVCRNFLISSEYFPARSNISKTGLANCTNVFPVYIGDDRTDEDAFKILRDRGQGFGILVSKIAKETNASYYLQEPSEVMDFLQRLVRWRRLSFRR